MEAKLPATRLLFLLAAVCFLIVPGVAMAQGRNLFSDVSPDMVKAAPRAMEALERINKRKPVIEVRVVRVDLPLLSETKEPVNLNVFKGKEFSVVLDRIERRGDKDYTWMGEITGKMPGTATFVVRDGNVTGMMRPGNEIYSVEPLGGGLHAVIRINPSRFPPDHPPSFEKQSGAPAKMKVPKREMKPIEAPWWQRWLCHIFPKWKMCITYIDVVVAYTPGAKAQVTDIVSLIQLAVDESNKSYSNSNISAKLRLVYKYEIAYTESGSFDTDLTRFRTPGDDYMDDIHKVRDKYKADVAVLIINNDDYCGLASTILADADEAFAVVHYDCATGYYSFAHEIGHLQGARHNCEIDPSTTPFAYGHGYLYTADGWRTIMAYNSSACPDGSCTRRQYWSNPNKSYGGVAMGTTCQTTTDCCADNHRVLNETRWTIASFR
jgi:hypothetical protein